MNSIDHAFRQIVLELKHGSHNSDAIRLAAELAELLHLDLLGRFMEDSDLARLAGLPCAREFRLLESEWCDLDNPSAVSAIDLAIATARRMFMRAAASSTAPHRFEVIGADASSRPGHRAQEIVAIVDDHSAGEPLISRLSLYHRDAIGTLLLPRRNARRRGSIVAIATREDESSVMVAAQVAASSGETLLRIPWPFDSSSPVIADARLVVVDASRLDEILPHIATLLAGVPILVLRTNGASAVRQGSKDARHDAC